MSYFWDAVWLMLSTFFFVAYLFIFFHILVDLFRDSEVGGVAKALLDAGTINADDFATLKAKALA